MQGDFDMKILQIKDYSQFIEVYKNMLSQFPPEELKELKVFEQFLKLPEYNMLQFYAGETAAGYLLCYIKDFIWVDYFAIYEQYHSQGYGTRILNTLFEKYHHLQGVYFEVECADSKKPCSARRLKFYEQLGCINTNFNYYFPNNTKQLKMELLYRPLNLQMPDNISICANIKNVFDALHGDVICREFVYKQIVNENT